MNAAFDFQGHRGARGLKPENTFPSFEVAFDLGVTAVETDVHLTCDGVPVLVHDAVVTERIFELIEGKSEPLPDAKLLVSSLRMDQLRSYRANRNPDPGRFPEQNRETTPLAALFSSQKSLDPYVPPSLEDLIAFTESYGSDLGRKAGKTPEQQARARRVCFDLELNRSAARRPWPRSRPTGRRSSTARPRSRTGSRWFRTGRRWPRLLRPRPRRRSERPRRVDRHGQLGDDHVTVAGHGPL